MGNLSGGGGNARRRSPSARTIVVAIAIAAGGAAAAMATALRRSLAATKAQTMSSDASVLLLVAQWPERPRLAAQQMMAKYGPPQETTPERMIWNDPVPYRRILVTREELPHDFPKPHMDFLEHTIEYGVPADKADDLIAFTGSNSINRTAGELSSRCDLEGHNLAVLNLDNDIVLGKKSVSEARKALGDIVLQELTGQHPSYAEALQFKPGGRWARFIDAPTMPGAPHRATEQASAVGGDAEALAFLIAIDENDIRAAAHAAKRQPSQQLFDYAKSIHRERGQNIKTTLAIAQKAGVTPGDTEPVERLRLKGARDLARLMPLDDVAFGRAYVQASIEDQTAALALIDTKLLKASRNIVIKKHLADTRARVAVHLQQAKSLQALASKAAAPAAAAGTSAAATP